MMGLAQMLRVLRGRALQRVRLIVLVVVTGVAVVGLLSPKKYVAELALVVALQGNDPMRSKRGWRRCWCRRYLATQTEIIKSPQRRAEGDREDGPRRQPRNRGELSATAAAVPI